MKTSLLIEGLLLAVLGGVGCTDSRGKQEILDQLLEQARQVRCGPHMGTPARVHQQCGCRDVKNVARLTHVPPGQGAPGGDQLARGAKGDGRDEGNVWKSSTRYLQHEPEDEGRPESLDHLLSRAIQEKVVRESTGGQPAEQQQVMGH